MTKAEDTRRRSPLLSFLIRLTASTVVFSGVIVLSQPLQVFPGAFVYENIPDNYVPPGVESHFIATEDGESVEVWVYHPEEQRYPSRAALVFHGNGTNMRGFFEYQRWLARLGMTSYAFDYRGYGRSTGWPGEESIYRDTDSVIELMMKREKIEKKGIVPVGISIGAAAAARAARNSGSETLILFSPYTSLHDLVSEMPLLGFLSPFLWYRFPTQEYLSDMKEGCIVIVHGKNDEVIPFRHSEKLAELNSDRLKIDVIASADAYHNDILFRAGAEAGESLRRCIP